MATSHTKDASQPDNDPIEQLIAEGLARLSSDGHDPIDEMCDAHPELASELRRRRDRLVAMGLWTTHEPQKLEIGRFDLLRELGRGGMGVVYLANEREPLRRLVAIKVIGVLSDPIALARFEAEQQTLARLAHPNIAQVLEAGHTKDQQPWYAMEFIDGLPLTRYCDNHKLPTDERLRIFLQVCEAVQYAHQQGVLHRDLKPANILVCEKDGQPVVKVIDFGLAKLLEPEPTAEQLTDPGHLLGTFEYMSPEQAWPTGTGVDTRCDVYALGSILYELCVGTLPLDFGQLRESGWPALRQAICEQDLPIASQRLRQLGDLADSVAERQATTASSLLRRLTGDLDWITQKALQKERDRRYASASELAADVRRHLANHPVLAGPPSALYQLRKFVSRNRMSVAFSAAFLIGLFVALAVVLNLLAQRNENLDRFDTLQVAIDCEELEQQIDHDLWPATPARLDAMDTWLAKAESLTGQLPAIRALRERVVASGREVDGRLQFEAPRDAALHAELGPLIARLEAMTAEGGSIEEIRRRRGWAAGLEQTTHLDHEQDWQKAIATIADREQCPRYDGLRITVQAGFVPLGRDEHSGLYEFAYPLEGQNLPERRDGRWAIEKDTCMVFVLMPGGEARVGLDWPDERLPQLYPDKSRPHEYEFVYADASKSSGLSDTVRLDPYFIGKYEVSQAQWLAVMDSNPSTYTQAVNRRLTLVHPVGGLTGHAADAGAHRFGLQLPTSAQWQHAARGGADAPWWTGYEREGWHGKENLADKSWAVGHGYEGAPRGELEGDYRDGFPMTAPVDSGMPNPNGLHNVLGNVGERTRDIALKPAYLKPRDGDGELEPRFELEPGTVIPQTHRRVFRGSFMTDWLDARSTMWWKSGMDGSAPVFGVRLCAPLRN